MWSRDKAPVVGLEDFIPHEAEAFCTFAHNILHFLPYVRSFAGKRGEHGPKINTLVTSPRPILLLLSAPFFPLSSESGGSRGPPYVEILKLL